jgi:hypothetical protein
VIKFLYNQGPHLVCYRGAVEILDDGSMFWLNTEVKVEPYHGDILENFLLVLEQNLTDRMIYDFMYSQKNSDTTLHCMVALRADSYDHPYQGVNYARQQVTELINKARKSKI